MQNRMSRTDTNPVSLPRQTMTLPVKFGHTMPMGRFVPLDFFPVMREDSVSGSINFALSLAETYEMLINPPKVRISAWFVSKLAEPRFSHSADIVLRSYMGEPETDTPDAIVQPYFSTAVMGAVSANAVARAMGLHWKTGDTVNLTPFEVYNLCWNHAALNRSMDITKRELDDYTLAPAFWWANSPFGSVVPQVDTGAIAGEVPLTVIDGQLPVSGMATNGSGFLAANNMRETDGTVENWAAAASGVGVFMEMDGAGATALPKVFAELQEHGVTLSLANIQQAGVIATFARERMKREGHQAEYLIDALLQGLRIPEASQRYPLLLNSTTVEFAQLLETANDGPSLGEKFALGSARGTIGFRLPVQQHGGTIMLIAEVLPEQLFEDQQDPLLYAKTSGDLPNRMRDMLRTAPWTEIKNGQVSVYHSTPDAQFGYEANNMKWSRHPCRFGGEAHRTAGGANSSVARRMLYPTEYVDPKLTEDFYLSETIGLAPFMNQAADPVKIGGRGSVVVNGLTLVGYAIESEENYDAVAEHATPLSGNDGE